MPLDFYITDQDDNVMNVQFILQLRFYKAELFLNEPEDEEAVRLHLKKQVFLYLTGDDNYFQLKRSFRYVALCQAYGDVGVQPKTNANILISYLYNLKVNSFKFDILSAMQSSIENVNNNVFVWTDVGKDNVLQFGLDVYGLEYDAQCKKVMTLKKDQ